MPIDPLGIETGGSRSDPLGIEAKPGKFQRLKNTLAAPFTPPEPRAEEMEVLPNEPELSTRIGAQLYPMVEALTPHGMLSQPTRLINRLTGRNYADPNTAKSILPDLPFSMEMEPAKFGPGGVRGNINPFVSQALQQGQVPAVPPKRPLSHGEAVMQGLQEEGEGLTSYENVLLLPALVQSKLARLAAATPAVWQTVMSLLGAREKYSQMGRDPNVTGPDVTKELVRESVSPAFAVGMTKAAAHGPPAFEPVPRGGERPELLTQGSPGKPFLMSEPKVGPFNLPDVPGQSTVRDPLGIETFHGTSKKFPATEFSPLSHFGTEEKATGRRRSGVEEVPEKDWVVSKHRLNITNPLRVPDFGEVGENFEPDTIAKHLLERGVLSRSEYESAAYDETGQSLIRVLEARGYDGLVYRNTGETGPPSDSYVIFRREQVRPVEESKVKYIPPDLEEREIQQNLRRDVEIAERRAEDKRRPPRDYPGMPGAPFDLHSGVKFDPEAEKNLVPAIKVGEKVIFGRQGQKHGEVLIEHGYDPKEYDHFHPARGFRRMDDPNPNNFFTREQAEKMIGRPGTADAGGLDSQDLPGGEGNVQFRHSGVGPDLGDETKKPIPPWRAVSTELAYEKRESRPPFEGRTRVGVTTAPMSAEDSASLGKMGLTPKDFEKYNPRQGNAFAKFLADHPELQYVSLEQFSKENRAIRLGLWKFGKGTGEVKLREAAQRLEEKGFGPAIKGKEKVMPIEEAMSTLGLSDVKGTQISRKSITEIPDQELKDRYRQAYLVQRRFRAQFHPDITGEGLEDIDTPGRKLKPEETIFANVGTAWERVKEVFEAEAQKRNIALKERKDRYFQTVKPEELIDLEKEILVGRKGAGVVEERHSGVPLPREVQEKAAEFLKLIKQVGYKDYEDFLTGRHDPDAMRSVPADVILRLANLENWARSFGLEGAEKTRFQEIERKFHEGGFTPEEWPALVTEYNKLRAKVAGGVEDPIALYRARKGLDELTSLYSGVSIQPVVDQIKKFAVDGRVLLKLASKEYRAPAEQITSKWQAVQNGPMVIAHRASNELMLETRQLFKNKGDQKQADTAVLAALAAQGDPANLPALRAGLRGKNKTLAAGIDFAEKNWANVKRIAAKFEAIDSASKMEALLRKVKVEPLHQFMGEAYKPDKGAMLSSVAPGMNRPAITYGSLFHAVGNDRTPRVLTASAMLEDRTSQIFRKVLVKDYGEALKRVNVPGTSRSLAADKIRRGRGKAPTAPPGYSSVEGFGFAIHEGFEPIFEAATGESVVRGSRLGQAALEVEGGIKHGKLAFDFYHLLTMSFFRWSLDPQSLRAPYTKGLSLLEYSRPELVEAIKQGKAPAGALKYHDSVNDLPQGRLSNGELLQRGIFDQGLMIGKHSEALYNAFVKKLPVFKQVNRLIFDQVGRGAMAESYITEVTRLAKAYPERSLPDIERQVAKHINIRFGNIGKEGIIKSDTMQDLTLLSFLAPRWFESLVQNEVRSVGQAGKIVGQIASGRMPVRDTSLRSTSNLALLFLVGTQVANYLFNGHFTWENENNKGHDLDVWIPPVTKEGKGFWISPMSRAAEVGHDMYRYTQQGLSTKEAALRIVSNKKSPLFEAWNELSTGFDYKGDPIENVPAKAVETITPLPLPFEQVRQSFKQNSIAPAERQFFSLLGVKAEPESNVEYRSRLAEGKGFGQRLSEAVDQTGKRDPLTREQRLVSQERSAKAEARRGSELTKELDKADRQWLEQRHLIIPGYKISLHELNTDVPLTQKEVQRYHDLIKEETQVGIRVLRDYYDLLKDPDDQKKIFSQLMSEAHANAREKLTEEILAKSDSMTEKNKRRPSIYR